MKNQAAGRSATERVGIPTQPVAAPPKDLAARSRDRMDVDTLGPMPKRGGLNANQKRMIDLGL